MPVMPCPRAASLPSKRQTSIWVKSMHGTTFKVYLPCAEQETEAVGLDTGSAEPPRRGSETILLVEDDDIVRDLAGFSLRIYGYTVLEAHDGDEALKICHEHEDPFQLLVTDVVIQELIPESQSGSRTGSVSKRPWRPFPVKMIPSPFFKGGRYHFTLELFRFFGILLQNSNGFGYLFSGHALSKGFQAMHDG